MKTYNLDKFANQRTVEYRGATYTIKGLTLEDEINGNISEKITSAETMKDRLLALKEFIVKSTDIPSDVIDKMTNDVLFALFKIAQGIDPDEKDDEGNASKE